MKKLLISLAVFVLGFGVGWTLHRPQDNGALDLDKALKSGGLTLDDACPVPLSLEYCISEGLIEQ